jgi:hypothetical protein
VSAVSLEPTLDSWTSATVLADASMKRVADLEHQLTAAMLEAQRLGRLLEAAEATRRVDQDQITRLQADVRELDGKCAEIEAEKIQLRDDTMLAEVSAEGARAIAAEMSRRMALENAAHAAELDAIHATKTMRWTAPVRRLYGRLRHLLGLR